MCNNLYICLQIPKTVFEFNSSKCAYLNLINSKFSNLKAYSCIPNKSRTHFIQGPYRIFRMSILKKTPGEKPDTNSDDRNKSEFGFRSKPDWTSFTNLLELHAGLSHEKQLIFGEVIAESAWQFDMNSGTISFGDNFEFPVQIIGSLSHNDHSWMWGWANAQSGIPAHLLEYSNELRALGEDKNSKELTGGHFVVDEGFEHQVGMIACGHFNTKSYYCADYGQGTLVVTIESDAIPDVDQSRFERILSGFPHLISHMELDHKLALECYLIDRGFQLKIVENEIVGLKNGKEIVGIFDQHERLKSLNGDL